MILSDDIIKDVLCRVTGAMLRREGFTDAIAAQIERQVRQDWGGENSYIKRGISDQKRERNAKILGDWAKGEQDAKRLATRYQLTDRQIRNIVKR